MGRSPPLRVYCQQLNAHFGLAFASPPSQKDLSLPLTITRRLIKQKARRPQHHFDSASVAQPNGTLLPHLDPATTGTKMVLGSTPCRRMISGTISLRSQR